MMAPSSHSGSSLDEGVLTGLARWKRETGTDAVDAHVVAMSVEGVVKDLTCVVSSQAKLVWIRRDDPEGIEILRHDAAHVLAQALKEIDPKIQITIGPVIEQGFYYDIAREPPFVWEDLPTIEARMHEIVDRCEPIVREEWSRTQAIDYFRSLGELFKVEIIEDLPEHDVISVYRQGNFIDLCRGPHLVHTGQLGHAFKLTKLAGAYWRGLSHNPMLQRIYGTAWPTAQALEQYLFQQEEAEKRDHRKLGKALGLFHMQEEAQGSVFWHPKGWALYRTLETYIRDKLRHEGYVEVKTPQLVDRSLWEASGHWEKFGENMFTTASEGQDILALKPMNCPCHIQIFNQGLKSYRDLPYRMAEFGSCHRNEASGALHGLMRVRAFVQDDAHIFCRSDQIVDETTRFCALLKTVYRELGFESCRIKFSDRPAVRAGADDVWDQAESALRQAAEASGLEYTLNPGEGAFYGPKLEFVLKDALGRDWQCGTLQLDFVLPQRLGAAYIGEDGQKHTPVMLHRAILGTFERFIGILIEHYAGKFPLWLAPVQVMVCPITSEVHGYAQDVLAQLIAQGWRAEGDWRNEKITFKIREHSLQKIPLLWILGKKEQAEGTVTVRRLGQDQQQTLSLSQAVAQMQREGRIFSDPGHDSL